jgi:16S rRNA G966 N2-methylase RsmD
MTINHFNKIIATQSIVLKRKSSKSLSTEILEVRLFTYDIPSHVAINTILSAILAADFRFDLKQCVGAMLRSDYHKLPAVRVAAIDFVQTTRRIAGSADNGSTCKNIVHERSGLGAVKQAGARLSFQSNSHDPTFFHRCVKRSNRNCAACPVKRTIIESAGYFVSSLLSCLVVRERMQSDGRLMHQRVCAMVKRRAAGGLRTILCAIVLAGSVAGISCGEQPILGPTSLRAPDVHYEPTPPDVVEVMLRLANVKAGDVVYDLGCGDGRIVITAVREFAARGVCVDIDPQRIAESQENARAAGVADHIRFLNQDLLVTDVSEATVVMLFLSPALNLAARPKLLRELKPGARIVSHWHDMGDWKPQKTVRVQSSGRERSVYLWTIPAR